MPILGMLSSKALDALRSRVRRRAFASSDQSLQRDVQSAQTAHECVSTADMQAATRVVLEAYRGEVERRRALTANA
jgi:hypothetical protein